MDPEAAEELDRPICPEAALGTDADDLGRLSSTGHCTGAAFEAVAGWRSGPDSESDEAAGTEPRSGGLLFSSRGRPEPVSGSCMSCGNCDSSICQEIHVEIRPATVPIAANTSVQTATFAADRASSAASVVLSITLRSCASVSADMDFASIASSSASTAPRPRNDEGMDAC